MQSEAHSVTYATVYLWSCSFRIFFAPLLYATVYIAEKESKAESLRVDLQQNYGANDCIHQAGK